jgi:hypothetical protein
MKYRTATLMAEENLGTSGTKLIDLNVQDPISALQFQARITVSTGARLIPEPDVMSKIELIDGSDVLLALSGAQMAAIGFYEGMKQIDWAACNLTSETEEGYLKFNFGRYLWDTLLAFDPKKFRNPQLRITFNTAAVQALATPLYLRINAELFDEKAISPQGFLQTKEFHSYVGAATTYEYIDLPTDLVLRKLYLQTKNFGAAHFQNLTSVRLSEDNDKRVPFDILVKDWMNLQLAEFGRCHQYVGAFGNGSSYPVWGAPCNVENFNVMNASAQAAIQATTGTGGKFSFDTASGTNILIGELSGSLPYFVHCYPFGDQMDMADWYDVTRIGSLRFRVYSGSAGASCTFNTILQQLRKY